MEGQGQGWAPPEITVTTNGDLLLNARAFNLLGEPQGVGLLYNADKSFVGVRGGGKVPVNRSGGQWRIEALAFLRRQGIIITATTTYEAALWPQVTAAGAKLDGDGALFIDISDLVDESDAFKELMQTPVDKERNG